MSPRRRSVLARPWCPGALLATALISCSTVRSDLCATIHARVLEEMRITEETPRHARDPLACERHAKRLSEFAQELRSLEIRDAGLRKAVDTYRTELERLAETYALLAAAHRQHSHAHMDENVHPVPESLRRQLMEHAASLNGPRTSLKSSCNGF